MLTHREATILGSIPDDWGRELLIDLLGEQQGGDWGDESGEVGIRVLRSTNFTARGTLDTDDVATRFFAAAKAAKMGLRTNDLLLERSGGGPAQLVGRIGFIERDLPVQFLNFARLDWIAMLVPVNETSSHDL